MKNESEVKIKHILKKPISCKEDQIIGNGSYGTVTRGFDVNNRITMAIKRIYINKNKKETQELISEVDFLKELQHPNIVKYYGSEV